jgi:hypothetical protein
MKLHFEADFTQVKDMQDGKLKKKIAKAMSLGVRDGLRNIEETHKKKFFLRGRGKNRKSDPNKIVWRTGTLAKSYVTAWKGGNLFGYYGTTLKRAALLEYGGTVKAKPGKALAIPTEKGMVGVGFTISPKYWPPGELFIPRFKGSSTGVLARIGKGGVLDVMFTLHKQVTIPARPTVKKSAKANEKVFQELMAKRVAKAMEKK